MALDILNKFTILPLPAEAFVENGFDGWTMGNHQERMESEMQGVSDWLAGTYHEQQWLSENFFKVIN